MKNPIQWLRSLLFITQMYLAMLVLGIVFAPWALVSPKGARTACKAYARWVIWTARWMVGIRTEVRGQVPDGEVIVAAKHQSFLDIIIIFNAVPSARFIMKRELMWTPVIGVYAKRLGCVPVNRGKRGAAIAKMVKDVAKETKEPGQLIIYSQGTRVAPGAKKPYKIGTVVLYEGLKQPCVPAATNAGVFWPRTGIYRKPGLAVVEFLEVMQPGITREDFMTQLEERVEARSDALMRDAGFDPEKAPVQA
ncbi:lysophospholipid acyltransferase family protein [Leisingera sp. ANG-DT]|uniref:lysophospholipid acyltransferase family protein n=1 Tax=Leisingera sp. ANG-DT TaxID=1577897 RepID=UPI00057E6DF6|nr:lysophospholipid acyltransferase family protein [Leisingera sp. ANG-DT]KIC16425.1 glycerol acyltransferase [Leisingera sp. ANG-DT]